MPPVEVNQQTGRTRRWKRSFGLFVRPASWTRDDSVSDNDKRSRSTSRGRARFIKPRQVGVGAGAGAGGVGDGQRDRSQSPDGVESGDELSGDDLLSEDSADELDDGVSDTDDDGTDSDIDSPPATPITDIRPTLTLSAPGVGVATTALPSTTAVPAIPSTATAGTVVDITTSPTSEPDVTLTPIVETAPETPSTASSPLITTVPLPEITSQPQKGVVQDGPPPAFTVPLPAVDESLSSETTSSISSTTQTSLPLTLETTVATPDRGKEYEYDDYDIDGDGFPEAIMMPPPPSGRTGLTQDSEHALIAVGSIGAFILFCFIAWIAYRTTKKYRVAGNGFADRFTRRRAGSQDGILGMPNEPPPVYEKLDNEMPQTQGFYGPGTTLSREEANRMRSGAWGSQQGTLRLALNDDGTGTLANILAGYRSESGTLQNQSTTLQNSNPNLTLGGRISDDQLGLANQTSDPYNAPKQRPVYRISQLSSLSSGFGDGDIVVGQPVVPQPLTAPPPVVTRPLREADDESERYDKRETVYTQTSEDRPARFRSIHSWVNQQTGRVQRASSRARERGEVPVMPAIPGELNVTQQTAYR